LSPHSIVVTRKIRAPALDLLQETGEVWISPHDRPLRPEELHEAVARADAVVTFLHDRIDDAFLDAAGHGLRVVANLVRAREQTAVKARTKRRPRRSSAYINLDRRGTEDREHADSFVQPADRAACSRRSSDLGEFARRPRNIPCTAAVASSLSPQTSSTTFPSCERTDQSANAQHSRSSAASSRSSSSTPRSARKISRSPRSVDTMSLTARVPSACQRSWRPARARWSSAHATIAPGRFVGSRRAVITLARPIRRHPLRRCRRQRARSAFASSSPRYIDSG
jgi:hypothetical protein